jgi:hypothetical protein
MTVHLLVFCGFAFAHSKNKTFMDFLDSKIPELQKVNDVKHLKTSSALEKELLAFKKKQSLTKKKKEALASEKEEQLELNTLSPLAIKTSNTAKRKGEKDANDGSLPPRKRLRRAPAEEMLPLLATTTTVTTTIATTTVRSDHSSQSDASNTLQPANRVRQSGTTMPAPLLPLLQQFPAEGASMTAVPGVLFTAVNHPNPNDGAMGWDFHSSGSPAEQQEDVASVSQLPPGYFPDFF